jgi:hypothetical protein
VNTTFILDMDAVRRAQKADPRLRAIRNKLHERKARFIVARATLIADLKAAGCEVAEDRFGGIAAKMPDGRVESTRVTCLEKVAYLRGKTLGTPAAQALALVNAYCAVKDVPRPEIGPLNAAAYKLRSTRKPENIAKLEEVIRVEMPKLQALLDQRLKAAA